MVQSHSQDKVDNGWSSRDYVTRRVQWKQKEEYGRHLIPTRSDKQKSNVRIVPPINKDLPFPQFKRGMHVKDFMRVWATNGNCQQILTIEAKTEGDYLQRRRPDSDSHPNFQAKSVQWLCWSGMLALEYCYPKMAECQSFIMCLHRVIAEQFEKASNTVDDVKVIMEYAAKIQARLFSEEVLLSYKTMVSRGTTFRRNIIDAIYYSKWWTDTFGKGNKAKQRELLVLPTTTLVKKIQRKYGEERAAFALTKPTTVHELVFVKGTQELVQQVYGKDLETTQEITIDTDQQCAAALCLLQLLCGSRSVGVIGVNWYGKVHHMLEEEFKDTSGITKKQVQRDYHGTEYCVAVHRLSKEKSPSEREYANRVKEAIEKGVDPETLDKTEVTDKTIVKPILFMYLDPRFFDYERLRDKEALTSQTCVDIFLRLASATRAYIKRTDPYGAKFTDSEYHPMTGFTDESAYNIRKETPSGKLVSKWNTAMRGVLVKIFPFIDVKGKGTHMLRKLYVNRAYYHYSSDVMKETGFASLVLGHASFTVSLNYTSIIFVPAIPIHKVDTSKKIKEQLAALDARVTAMEESDDTPSPAFEHRVAFTDSNGKVVTIPRLSRAPRKTTNEEHLARAQKVIDQLFALSVPISLSKLYRAGVIRSSKKIPILEMLKKSQPFLFDGEDAG